MPNLVFYCGGGLGNRLSPILNIKDVFNYNLHVVWPPTKRLMCEFNDLFENKNLKILSLSELEGMEDVDNYHGNEGGLVAAGWETHLNGNISLQKLAEKYPPKPISLLNFSNLPHKNTVIFYNAFIGQPDKEVIKENFNKLKPKKDIVDKINNILIELKIDKNTIGIHARGTDFFREKVEKYFPIIENELNDNNDIFFCSDDPDWENIIKKKYPNIKMRSNKDNVYKIDKSRNYNSNIMTPLDSVKDAYIDMVLLSKTNFKHFNGESSFAALVNLIA